MKQNAMKTNLRFKSISSSLKSFLLLFFFISGIFTAQTTVTYSGSFTSSTGATGSYSANKQITLSSKTWLASYSYLNTTEFRLGSNNSVNVPNKFLSSTLGSSIEMQWDVANVKKISFSNVGSYGTVGTWRIFESTDGGSAWTQVATSAYSNNSTISYTATTPQASARYALIITGDKSRAILTDVSIEIPNSTTSYSVTFNGNGNTGGTMSAQSASSATKLTANAFAKTGYNFGGWASSVANATAGTVAYADQASYPFSSSTTLYAIWGFGITYNNNGGSGTIASQSGYYNGTAGSGTLTLSNGSAFSRPGYTFGGWKTTSTGASANYAVSGTYTHSGSSASVTLYAHWVPVTYSLTYNGNDNTSAAGTVPANQTYSAGDNITLANATNLVKDGYILDSWNSTANGNDATTTYALGGTRSNMPASNQTIYARWKFTVAYDSNGGSGSVPGQNGFYNGTTGVKSGTLTLSNGAGLTRSGYTFGGWKTSATATSADYGGGDTYTHSGANSTVTLYAHWVLNESTLTVTPGLLSGFNYVESHGPSSQQSFTLEGIHLDGSAVNLLPGDNYEISLDNGTTWVSYANAPVPVSYSGTSFTTTVLVRLMAGLPAGTYSNPSNNIVAVEGGGDGSGPIVTLQGSVSACLAPTTQSSVSSFSSVTAFGMAVNLTAGNGLGRIVKINTTNSFTDPVSSNALPTANPSYSGSGEQVVYSGTGNTVTVTGLAASTNYYFRVYEYNICSGNYIYNTTTATNNPGSQATICDVPANPNGEITPSESPNCGSAVLIYKHGTAQPQSGVTYYWQATASGTSISNPVVFVNASTVSEPFEVTSSGIYYVRSYNGTCWSAGSSAMQSQVVISTSANISTQPNDQSVAVGANVSFSVTASGTAPYTYQWQESPTGAAGTWSTVGTAATYAITGVSIGRSGYKYRVIVANACASKISNVATLTVTQGPCMVETFEKITSTSANNYIDRSWTGDNGGIWKATAARADRTLNGKAITTNGSGSITSPTISGGIGKLTFNYVRDFSGTGSRTIEVWVNGSQIGSDITVSPTSNTVVEYSQDINISGDVYLELRTSGTQIKIDDIEWACYSPACTPATITAFPTTGPAGTVVTITGTNFNASSTVKFGTANATVQYISATQLEATVPATATGNIIVDTTLDCDSETAFTLINTDISACESIPAGSGSANASDIIIYEVYDENGGNGGIVSLYNRTGATVNLTGYSIQRADNYGGVYSTYANLTGTIASEAVAVIGVSSSKCGYTPTGNGSFGATGFNANDGFRLVKNSVVIDDVKTPNYIGYYLKRKNEYLSPNSTFTDAEWSAESIDKDECLAGVVAKPPVVKAAPLITVQPSYSVNCDVVNTSLVLTATEGLAGGVGLAYQWYVLGTSGTWTAVSNGGVYSGATSATLNISNVTGLDNYQYYCQVRENTQTCYAATKAVQIKPASNTWASNIWSNGTPVLGSKVIIAGSYDTQTQGALDVCQLTINSGGTVVVESGQPLKVKKKIINLNTDANSFVIKSDANLIQIDNVTNEGIVKVERAVTGMNNVTGKMDYVYWSSPVDVQNIKSFSPATPANGYLQYNESNDKFSVTKDTSFKIGKGYAIRAENGFQDGYSNTYSFNGVPNNGDLQFSSLQVSSGTDKGYNLVGNPYPSNIDFDLLYLLNSTKIYNTAWFWTNIEYKQQQMGSGYTGNNYAVYNGSGGVPPTYDWADYNPDAPSGLTPNGNIKMGQGFIVQAKTAGPLDFNNEMRVTDNGTFYQKSNPKNRFWLTIRSPKNMVNTILISYVPGASNGYEKDFDGELFVIGSDSFYSVLGAKKLAIQGRDANFSEDDIVRIGHVFSVDGTYHIRLQTPEGIFASGQSVYLKDKLLNKYIDLSTTSDYSFTAVKGTDTSRFEIVYKDGTVLGSGENTKSDFMVYRDRDEQVIRSSKKLGRIEVFDATGKLIKSVKTNETEARINTATLPQGFYILRAENSGEIRTKKFVK